MASIYILQMLSVVTVLFATAAAVSRCADLEGKNVYLRAPWYASQFDICGNYGVVEPVEFATDTMQVSKCSWTHHHSDTYTVVLMYSDVFRMRLTLELITNSQTQRTSCPSCATTVTARRGSIHTTRPE